MERTFSERIAFLSGLDPELQGHLSRAAQLCFEDRASCHVALRRFAEQLVFGHLLPNGGRGLSDALGRLRRQGDVPSTILDHLNDLRILGNRGAHATGNMVSGDDPTAPIEQAYEVASWFFQSRGGDVSSVPVYRSPTPVEGYKIYRDAMIGGEYCEGDPEAKYHVAIALGIEQRVRLDELSRSGSSWAYVPSTRERSIELLREAAYSVPAARSKLAHMLLDPPRVAAKHPLDPPVVPELTEDDLEEIAYFLDWSIEDDDPHGCFLRAVWYMEGWHGQEQDQGKARELFERAAAHEHPDALNALCVMFHHDESIGEDAPRDLARRAAHAGSALGQFHYAVLLLNEAEEEEDDTRRDEAVKWLVRATNQELPGAMFVLGRLVLDEGLECPPAVENPEQLIERAAQAGYGEAKVWLAEAALAEGEPRFAEALWLLNESLTARFALSQAEHVTIEARMREVYSRFTTWLRDEVSCADPRYQDLSLGWFYFNESGAFKFATKGEFYEFLGFPGYGGGSATNPFNINYFRAFMGPQATEEQVRFAWKSMLQGQQEHDGPKSPRKRKLGRNEPCHCGSGRKYKRCCLRR